MTLNTHAKGSNWRRSFQYFLNAGGWSTRFRSIGEAGDDISAEMGGIKLSVEAKNHKTITLAAFVDQAVSNAGTGEIPIVAIKRRGKAAAADAYVVMPAWAFARLIERLQ